MDEKKLPRAKVREDGKLEVEGDKYPLIQGMIRSLVIEVRDVTYHRYYEVYDGKTTAGGRVSGTAHIQKGDALDVAGMQGVKTTQIPFSVRATDSAQHQWTCSIGFLPYDWEVGHQDEFYIECYVPTDTFGDLESAYVAGRVTTLSMFLDTNLWIHDFDEHTPPSGDVTWFLVPEVQRQSDMPRHESGRIKTFGWQEVPALRSKPPKPAGTPPEETSAYKAGQEFARDTIRTGMDDGPPTVTAKPKRSWGTIAMWAAVILFAIGYLIVKQQ